MTKDWKLEVGLAGAKYRFDRFHTGLLLKDMRFSGRAPRPGERIPDFELHTPEGQIVRSTDFVGHKPLVIVTGSLTCPMTASSMPDLNRLYQEFGDAIAFALVYVREGHPGEEYPQPHDFSEKAEHARVMREIYGVSWPVIIDDIDGTLHRALDSKPNSLYIVDASGTIVFRSVWAGDTASVNEAVRRVAEGEPIVRSESQAMLGPLFRSFEYMWDVITMAGHNAVRDLILGAPPAALGAWLAKTLRRSSKLNAVLPARARFLEDVKP